MAVVDYMLPYQALASNNQSLHTQSHSLYYRILFSLAFHLIASIIQSGHDGFLLTLFYRETNILSVETDYDFKGVFKKQFLFYNSKFSFMFCSVNAATGVRVNIISMKMK
jgi:hypothetical protein